MNGLKIENKEQFNKIYHLLRSANRMDLETWLKTYTYPEFPICLEKVGNSYGYTTRPFYTWSGNQMDVKDYERP